MAVAVAATASSSRCALGPSTSHRHPLLPVRFSPPPQPYASPAALLWRRPPRAAPTTFCSAPRGQRLAAFLPRREGSAWLLSFRADPSSPAAAGAADPSHALSALLPLVVAATAIAALGNPATFSWVSKEYYAPALGGIMLSIGIKLSIDDFKLAFRRPVPLSIGYVAQYVLKPLLGVLIARVFRMPSAFFAGFVLTCCVSGAQLSSYASLLSKGDVALSILLTSCSTISSVVVTPVLTGLLIGSVVPVDGIAMAKSILQVVLVPVTLGLLLNTYAKAVVNVIQPVMPFVAMVCTSLCIGSPLAINRSKILSSEGLMLLLPIVTFHIVAFAVGYWISKLPLLSLKSSGPRLYCLPKLFHQPLNYFENGASFVFPGSSITLHSIISNQNSVFLQTSILLKCLDPLLLILLHWYAGKKSLFVGLFQCVLECRAPP